MTLNEFAARCHSQAVTKGFDGKVPITEMIALCHSELSEGLESYRNNEETSWTDPNGKPQGLASEFADTMIRIGHYCTLLGIDLEYEIERKLQYNMTRPHRHGGKAI